MYLVKKNRRGLLALNVTALIDICSIIIIFLIMGTVFGESSISVPPDLSVPQSSSVESVENAPRVLISGKEVHMDFLAEPVALEHFRDDQHPRILVLKEQVKKYVGQLPVDAKGSGVLLNFIADEKTPYKDVFNVVKVYREAGFQSVLFVARGKE